MNFKALKIIDSALEGGDKDIDLYGKGIDEASFKYLLNKEGISCYLTRSSYILKIFRWESAKPALNAHDEGM